MIIHIVAAFVHTQIDAISSIGPLLLGVSKGLLGILYACKWPFCVHAAVAYAMTFEAYIALRAHKTEHAQELAIHGFAGALLALAHLLG
jgi:hypothetical protein